MLAIDNAIPERIAALGKTDRSSQRKIHTYRYYQKEIPKNASSKRHINIAIEANHSREIVIVSPSLGVQFITREICLTNIKSLGAYRV